MAGSWRHTSVSHIPGNAGMSVTLYCFSLSPPAAGTVPISGDQSDANLRAQGDYEFGYHFDVSHLQAALANTVQFSFPSDFNESVGPFALLRYGPPARLALQSNLASNEIYGAAGEQAMEISAKRPNPEDVQHAATTLLDYIESHDHPDQRGDAYFAILQLRNNVQRR